jgi:hypothetical protein
MKLTMKLPANNLMTTRLIKRFPRSQLILSYNEIGMSMDPQGPNRLLKGTEAVELLPSIMVTLVIKG